MATTTSTSGSGISAQSADFSATAACQDRTVAATLTGTADLTAKKALDDFLSRLHDTARSQGVAEVVVDFKSLAFMNSSCLKGFVTWICAVQELPPQTQYRIVLVSSPQMLWQQRSLHALSCLATDLVTLQS